MNDFSCCHSDLVGKTTLNKDLTQLASGCFPVLLCKNKTQSNVILHRHKAARQGSINSVCTIVSALFHTITWTVHNHDRHPGLPLRQMVQSTLQHWEMQLLQEMIPTPLIQVCSKIDQLRKRRNEKTHANIFFDEAYSLGSGSGDRPGHVPTKRQWLNPQSVTVAYSHTCLLVCIFCKAYRFVIIFTAYRVDNKLLG